MADDLSKNITITVTAETDQLEQSITNLNKIIDSLLAKQKQLADAGKTSSDAFQNNADKIDIFQKSLQNATTQLNAYLSVLNSTASSLQKNQSLITALTSAKDKYSKTLGDNSNKVKELNAAIKTLSSSTQQHQTQTEQNRAAIDDSTKSLADNAQQSANFQDGLTSINDTLYQQKQAIEDNKNAFNDHKLVIDHLKTSFDQIKDVSGEFGPSLQDAAKGFNAMKDGLSIVKGGLKGVGEAIKVDGFDFLLQILQYLFDAFVTSSEGSKILKSAISAIGVIVNKVNDFIGSFKTGFVDALTHPVESIKALGSLIMENIINRFTAFSVILDGIIHLDFKKVADGAIQAISGVANATDKIVAGSKSIVNTVEETGKAMAESYKKVSTEADKATLQSDQTFSKSVQHKIKSLRDLRKATKDTNKETASDFTNKPPAQRGPDLPQAVSEGVGEINTSPTGTVPAGMPPVLNPTTAQDNSKKVIDIAKTTLKQLEEDAKNSAAQIATDALNILENSIKQQSEAKIAALEKSKAAELSNSSLTGAQKAAIEAKFKKQEDQVKAKAFKQEQELSIAQAVINGALAVTKATSQTGILAELAVPIIIAETAAEVAKIASQKPPAYAKGGLHYNSDGRGGLLPGYSRTDNTNAYLRSGEGIVVSEAMRDPWARNLVSAINVGFGGRDFSVPNAGRGYAVGGIFTDGGDANRYYNQPVNDNKNLANTLAYQMINNFPPVYVDVKDINNQQNILAQTINRVTL